MGNFLGQLIYHILQKYNNYKNYTITDSQISLHLHQNFFGEYVCYKSHHSVLFIIISIISMCHHNSCTFLTTVHITQSINNKDYTIHCYQLSINDKK